MNEYEALSQRIDAIESVQIHELRNSVSEIKETQARTNVLVEQCIKSNERLADTMATVSETMINLTHGLQDSNRVTTDLAKKMESFEDKLNDTNAKMDEKFSSLRGEVELVDGKSKVDVLELLKNNWKPIVALILGAGGGSLAVDKFNIF